MPKEFVMKADMESAASHMIFLAGVLVAASTLKIDRGELDERNGPAALALLRMKIWTIHWLF
jgi:hypothetical protein